MTALVLALVAAVAAGSSVLKPEIRNVRIHSPKVSVSRQRSDSESFVSGQIRVDMSFANAMAKSPVLRLSCLCEIDGEFVVRSLVLNRLQTYEGMRESDITAAFKNAGVVVPGKERAAYYGNPAKFTPYLPEVSRTAYASAAYGTGELDRGFFRLGRSKVVPKVLLHRVEVWQNGVLVAKSESSRAGLGKYGIPSDWYEPRKYPQKYRYADVR